MNKATKIAFGRPANNYRMILTPLPKWEGRDFCKPIGLAGKGDPWINVSARGTALNGWPVMFGFTIYLN